jgi:methionyl-tRNA synthetase
MVGKYFGGEVPCDEGGTAFDWPGIAAAAVARCCSAMDAFDLPAAIEAPLRLVRRVDAFINDTEPFKIARDASRRGELGTILYQCLEAIRIASLLLSPVMPNKMEELWAALRLAVEPRDGRLHELARWGGLAPGTQVAKVALFPRVELECVS